MRRQIGPMPAIRGLPNRDVAQGAMVRSGYRGSSGWARGSREPNRAKRCAAATTITATPRHGR